MLGYKGADLSLMGEATWKQIIIQYDREDKRPVGSQMSSTSKGKGSPRRFPGGKLGLIKVEEEKKKEFRNRGSSLCED